MLGKFPEMKLKDARKGLRYYMNFIRINKEIRKMASIIVHEWKIKLDMHLYDVDSEVVDSLKVTIANKEAEIRARMTSKDSTNSLLQMKTNETISL